MPMPYSHLTLAYSCLDRIAVHNKNDFYLGALMPDIRYFTGKPRSEYHFPLEKLNRITRSISISDSFVLGYGIHLIIDELWAYTNIRDEYKNLFPIFIRNKLNNRILEVAFELFFLTQYPVNVHLIVSENEFTKQLGINLSPELINAISSFQRYIEHRNLHTGLQIALASGKYTPERLAQMRYLSNILEISPFTRALIHCLIAPPSRQIHKRLVDATLERIDEIHISNHN